jgi:hypothetical protein
VFYGSKPRSKIRKICGERRKLLSWSKTDAVKQGEKTQREDREEAEKRRNEETSDSF